MPAERLTMRKVKERLKIGQGLRERQVAKSCCTVLHGALWQSISAGPNVSGYPSPCRCVWFLGDRAWPCQMCVKCVDP